MRLETEEDVGESILGRRKVNISKASERTKNWHVQDVFKEQKMDAHD